MPPNQMRGYGFAGSFALPEACCHPSEEREHL
jgi:hypothetical protein